MDTSTASADVTHPEQARQSVREIWAGGRSVGKGVSVLKLISCSLGVEEGAVAGRVSTGLMQATPGEMKSFRSSAERIALIFAISAVAVCSRWCEVTVAMYCRRGCARFGNFEGFAW